MKTKLTRILLLVWVFGTSAAEVPKPNSLTFAEKAAGWYLLFDGNSLDGWRANELPGSFAVRDGQIVAHGAASHLFYVGPVGDHNFKNFEFTVDVLTRPNSNSGVYFHTVWQPQGFPNRGFEVQINNSQDDPSRTAGLYDIKDNYETVARDNAWFVLRLRVEGKHVVTSVDGKIIVDYTEPDDWKPIAKHPERRISSGTFALQEHDPGSEIHFRNIKVRALP